MSTSVAEINRIVRTSPTELKYLFKSPTEDKRRLTRLISHLVPYRVGIEFETFGAVGQNLFPKESLVPDRVFTTGSMRRGISGGYVKTSKDPIDVNKLICKKLGLVAFREDAHTFSLDPPINQVYVEGESDMNEVRISISGYKQLITLYNTLQVLSRYLIIPKINGGIHIHIDAPFVSEREGKKFAIKWFNKPAILSEVLQIFEGYTGTYNKRKASEGKASYIRVSDYPTIEFRIGRLTYDYNTIIRYIIKCSELVRRCRHDAVLNGTVQSKGTDKDDVELETRENTCTTQLDLNAGVYPNEVVDGSESNLRSEVRALQEYVFHLENRLSGIQDLGTENSWRCTRYNTYDSPF